MIKIKSADKEFIFEEERPFASCHSSSLIFLPNGDICATWFGGSREGAEDVAIWFSKRRKKKWSYPVKVVDQEGIPHWNPVLFRNVDGSIILYYKIGFRISEWITMFVTSYDNGGTWSKPKELVEGDRSGGRGPVKNKPIILHDGRLLAPASIEYGYWDAFVDISYDKGKTWVKSETVPIEHYEGDKGIIQPTLWESEPSHVHMLLRSSRSSIYRSDSKDGGKTWSPAYATSLPNNNSGIDVVKLEDGTLVLAYNPTAGKKGPRTPLILSISTDNGVTWKKLIKLDEGEKQYSYPSIISEGNRLYVTYTWRRERIAFWEIEIERVWV